MKNFLKIKKGFTLIELVIYVAAFAIITTLVTLFVFNLIRAQTKTRIIKEVSENAGRAMELMLWEIRNAEDVYLSTSSFGSHPGQLSLLTDWNTSDDEDTTYLDFYLDQDDLLCIKREGNNPEPLVPKNIKVTNLVFTHLTVDEVESIRIELSVAYNLSSSNIAYQATTTLISSAVLRR